MSVDKTDKDVSSRRAPPFIAVRCGIDKAHIYRYMKNVIYLQKKCIDILHQQRSFAVRQMVNGSGNTDFRLPWDL